MVVHVLLLAVSLFIPAPLAVVLLLIVQTVMYMHLRTCMLWETRHMLFAATTLIGAATNIALLLVTTYVPYLFAIIGVLLLLQLIRERRTYNLIDRHLERT